MSRENETYYLNPYATILETERAFVINSIHENSLSFAKTDRAFVQQLMAQQFFTYAELCALKGETIVRHMIDKRVLLPEGRIPATSGRYSRQEGFFSHITEEHQAYSAKLAAARLLILGAGAIGSHVLWNMAAIGVKDIAVVDFDCVEESNLNRQLMYEPDDIGRYKVDVLAEKMARFNPEVRLTAYKDKIHSPADLEAFVAGRTLVIKAIDTPERATEWLNALCVKHSIPYVNGGFMDYEGVVGPIFIPGRTLCAACLGSAGEVKKIKGVGPTFAPLTTAVSSRISMIAFRMLAGDQLDTITNKIFTYKTMQEQWETVPVRAVAACKVCGQTPDLSAERKRVEQVKSYRIAVACIALFAALLRLMFHTNLAGFFALFCLFVSLFFLKHILKNHEALLQKEMFNASCIYTLIILSMNTADAFRMSGERPPLFSMPGLFAALQALFTYIIQAGIAITFVFILLHLAMRAVSLLQKTAGRWAG